MPTSPAQRVASHVRAELARQQKNQTQLGGALGLSQTAVSRRLTGEVAFDVTELAQVAVYLGVPLTAFLADGAPVPQTVRADTKRGAA